MTAQSQKTFSEAKADQTFWGRVVESMIGAHLLNNIRGTDRKLYYWREGNNEVDFVIKSAKETIAIEVKSGTGMGKAKGMEAFFKKFNPQRTLLLGEGGIPLADFLLQKD
jgi:predicted AAA+ superfamily ATPase